jgi:POT family proton-dependent oligopeptide transporter
MPVGDDNVVVSNSHRITGHWSLVNHVLCLPSSKHANRAAQQATSLDPAFVDRSGDPERKHPELHTETPPVYLHSEGKATMQGEYLDHDDFPTEEEMRTLRRVPAGIPWRIYSIAFVELVERLSYYGTTAVYSNFIAKPALTRTGAAPNPDDEDAQPGALGLGK